MRIIIDTTEIKTNIVNNTKKIASTIARKFKHFVYRAQLPIKLCVCACAMAIAIGFGGAMMLGLFVEEVITAKLIFVSLFGCVGFYIFDAMLNCIRKKK